MPASLPPSRRGSWKRRFGALLLGILLTPLLLEGALQLASLTISSSRAHAAGESLVLCQGDSNVYGFNLDAEHSFPSQLEALLREGGQPEALVVNCGVPGKPTWVVRDELGEDLDNYSPKALVVLAGLNDRNMMRPEKGSKSWVSKIRTINLARRLVSGVRESGWAPDEEEKPNILTHRSVEKIDQDSENVHFLDRAGARRSYFVQRGEAAPEVYQNWIVEDLKEVAEQARAAGVEPFLVTYPVDDGPFTIVNRGIEQAAEVSGARLVDPRLAFSEAILRLGRDELVFPDGHPTQLGYAIVARSILGALIEKGIVEGEAPDPIAALEGWKPLELKLEPWFEGDRAVGMKVHYGPGFRVQLLLSRSQGNTPMRWRGVAYPCDEHEAQHHLPLAHDEVLEASWRAAEDLLVPFTADGEADIRIVPELLGEEKATSPLWASVVVVAPGSRVVAISEAVLLQ